MFEFFKGKLIESTPSKAVIEVGGIGYGLLISLRTYEKLPAAHETVFLYALLVIKEDDHSLYGFLSLEEKMLFQQLTTVSGIGPKTAISILGHIEMQDFQLALMQANAALLSKVPGIGPKTAQRLILELKDKVQKISFSPPITSSLDQSFSHLNDAISALMHLGYSPVEAHKKVKKALTQGAEDATLADLISLALSS